MYLIIFLQLLEGIWKQEYRKLEALYKEKSQKVNQLSSHSQQRQDGKMWNKEQVILWQ